MLKFCDARAPLVCIFYIITQYLLVLVSALFTLLYFDSVRAQLCGMSPSQKSCWCAFALLSYSRAVAKSARTACDGSRQHSAQIRHEYRFQYCFWTQIYFYVVHFVQTAVHATLGRLANDECKHRTVQ